MLWARTLYLQALDQSPGNPLASFRLGLLELQEGHAESALPLIITASRAMPSNFHFQFGLGEVFTALSRWSDAAAAYRQALLLDAASADACYALGNALVGMGDQAAAIASFESAVSMQPDFADAFLNMGNAWKMLGNLPRAAAAYERALVLRPGSTAALSNLGVVLHAGKQDARAMQCLRAAVGADPNVAGYAINLAAALSDRRQFDEAAMVAQRAVQLDPNSAQAAFNLGIALQGSGKSLQAITQYQRAITLMPTHVQAMNNLGMLQKQRGEFSDAMQSFESAIQTDPGFVPAMNNAGCLLRTLGKLEDAQAMLRRGLAINDRQPALLDNLGSVLKDAGQLDEAIACYRQSLAIDPASAQTHSNLIFSLAFSHRDPRSVLDQCQRWGQMHADPLRSEIRVHDVDRSPGRRLRIGYVSPDFRDHCQSLFTIPLLSNHDHHAFEIVCYSSKERPDALTRRIAGYADLWREVLHLDDAALAQQIRQDSVDILIDLTMHMASGRPLVFARKPAPIQIAWLAYPGTTGVAAMDYRVSDPRLDPDDFDSNYTEKTLRLPDSFWCYDPLATQPQVNDLPALDRGFITLGCLNNPSKLTDDTLELWSGAMHALPTARLLLMTAPGSYRQRLLERLAVRGIVSTRVDFLSYRPRADYLRSYHQIDLGLDTLPYNGHTTSLDSFWMGVPVVTRIGSTCVGRGGLSQMFQLDLMELTAETDKAFVDIVVKLASNLPALQAIRKQLRSRLERSPLMDGQRFAKNMESLYQQCWERFLVGKAAGR